MPIKIGNSIKPAPCADAIRNDHSASSGAFTRIATQRGCARGQIKRNSPKRISAAAPIGRSKSIAKNNRRPPMIATTAAIDTRCPNAIGPSAHITFERRRSCRPSATANSQPIDGSIP